MFPKLNNKTQLVPKISAVIWGCFYMLLALFFFFKCIDTIRDKCIYCYLRKDPFLVALASFSRLAQYKAVCINRGYSHNGLTHHLNSVPC